MASRDKIIPTGIPFPAAAAIMGDTLTALTATGTTQAGALALLADVSFVSTAAASSGVILPPGQPGDVKFVFNGGANTLTVYPPVGGTINNLSANTGFSVATVKSAFFVCSGGLGWASCLSA